MEISIVVCIYNGERTLNTLLNSLVNQDFDGNKYEIVLIDDGSKDTSVDICKEFIMNNDNKYSVKLFEHNNKGLSAARNAGIMNSKGNIIAFIDQDAAASRSWIKNIYLIFESNIETIVVSGITLSFEEDSLFSKFVNKYNYSRREGVKRVIGTNMAFRKTFFEEQGGFFDIFNHAGDETALLSIRKVREDQIEYSKEVIVEHHFSNKFLKWLKEKKSNGAVSYVIDCMLNEGKRVSLKFNHIIKFSYFLFPIIALINNITINVIFYFIISFFFLIRINRNCIGVKEICKDRKRVTAFAIIPVFVITIFGIIFTDIGYLSRWVKWKPINRDLAHSSFKPPKLIEEMK